MPRRHRPTPGVSPLTPGISCEAPIRAGFVSFIPLLDGLVVPPHVVDLLCRAKLALPCRYDGNASAKRRHRDGAKPN